VDRIGARPDGGYVLESAVRLSTAQAVAVAVALATQRQPPLGIDGPDRAAALAKVLDVLDADARQRATELAEQIWARTEPAGAEPVLDEALRRHLVVQLDYVDGDGQPTRRRVEPLLLARTSGRRYLVGWCQQRDAVRWFRCDRIQTATLTADPAPPRKLALPADEETS